MRWITDISIKMDRLDPTTFLLQHSSRPRKKLKRNGIDASGFGAESMNASTPGPKRRWHAQTRTVSQKQPVKEHLWIFYIFTLFCCRISDLKRRAGLPPGLCSGGVEYRPNPGSNQVFRPNGPPPADYPVQVESNNAMANQPAVDHSWTGVWAPQHIVGRPRLITAKRDGESWSFTSKVLWIGIGLKWIE